MKEHNGYRYAFTMQELTYFIFGKKNCPQCGSKLEKEKDYVTRTDLYEKAGFDSPFAPGAIVKEYTYGYHCRKCQRCYSLEELSTKRKEKPL